MFDHKRIVLGLMSAYGMDTHLHDIRYGSKRTSVSITQGKKPSTLHFLDIQAVLAGSEQSHKDGGEILVHVTLVRQRQDKKDYTTESA
jgi:hypothetical protein